VRGYPLSDPPTLREVEGLGAYVSGRVVVEYEDDAVQLVLLGPEGVRLVRYALKPAEGHGWSEVPVVAAAEAFGRSLDLLADVTGQNENPQGTLLRLDEHAADVVQAHPGVQISRVEIYTLDDRDWLV
jgi:hypothetical protein